MLVLTRPDGEGILLETPAGDIKIFVERASGHRRVKIFCDAPRQISISRIDKDGTKVGNKKCQSTRITTPIFHG